jgi:hypothetical protein
MIKSEKIFLSQIECRDKTSLFYYNTLDHFNFIISSFDSFSEVFLEYSKLFGEEAKDHINLAYLFIILYFSIFIPIIIFIFAILITVIWAHIKENVMDITFSLRYLPIEKLDEDITIQLLSNLLKNY